MILENLGSAEARSIRIVAFFETDNEYIRDLQQSEPSILGVDGKARVTFYLDFLFAEHNCLITKTIHDDCVIHESYNEWSQK